MGEFGPKYPPEYASDPGPQWHNQSIRVQAVAARTWVAYKCNHPLTDGQPFQEFRPYDVRFTGIYAPERTRFINQSYATRGIYMTYDTNTAPPYDGVIIDAEYRSDNADDPYSCSWRSGLDTRPGCLSSGSVVTGYDFLPSVNNPHDARSGYNFGPGYAQRDGEEWLIANQGLNSAWNQLLHQYYYGVWMQSDPPDYSGISAYFYNSSACTGGMVWSDTIRSVNYDWGTGSPKPGIVNNDHFCAVWTQVVDFDYSDWYTFWVLADDGFKVYLKSCIFS